MGEVGQVDKNRKQLKSTPFPRIAWKEGYFERKKSIIPSAMQTTWCSEKFSISYMADPSFAKIYASYYENSGR